MKNDKLGETVRLCAVALALFLASTDFCILLDIHPCLKVMSNHPHFQQIFVFKADSHQILKLVLFLCFNMKILSSENVYLFIMTVGCWMQFTCVDVWGDGRKEVWPGDAFWVMTLWVGRMTLRPGWEGGEWCIKTEITTLLDCKQMYCWLHCCTLWSPGARFVLDMSLVCQVWSVKCNFPPSCSRAFLWPWLWFGWFGE